MEPTPPDQSSGPASPHSLDPVQVDLVKSLLVESYSAKDVKEYPENNNGRERLKLYFSFDNRNEARAFLDFIYESKYRNKGIHSKLRAYLLQTEQTFVDCAGKFASSPAFHIPDEEKKDSTSSSPKSEMSVVQSAQNQKQPTGV